MNVLLVAGGTQGNWPAIQKEAYDFFVGIDRGSLYLIENGWPLDLAVGDFDSLTTEEHDWIVKEAKEVQSAQSEKDDTDTQLALATALERFSSAEITLLGATGGRLDHFLSNLWLPLEPRFREFATQIRLIDEQNTITYYPPGNYTVRKEPDKKYLAYVCLTPVINLTLEKSKYTLRQVTVDRPISYASNEFVGDSAGFSFDAGMIAVIQSRDR